MELPQSTDWERGAKRKGEMAREVLSKARAQHKSKIIASKKIMRKGNTSRMVPSTPKRTY